MTLNTRRMLTVLASAALVASAAQQPLAAGAARGMSPKTASTASRLGGWSAPFRVLPAGDGAAVSCSSGLFCTAVSYDGSAAQGHGRQWGAPQTVISGTDNPYGLSCASDGTCMMVTREAQFAVFDGTSWSTATQVPGAVDSIFGVSCLSASFCDVADPFEVISYDGSTWSAPARLPHAKGVLSISCTSRTFCAATGYVLAFIWDGDSWVKSRRLDLGSNIWSVSCVSASFCMGSDDHGKAFEWDGSRWSKATVAIPGSAYSSAVSCATATFCVMATQHQAEVSTFDGTSWSDPVQIDDPSHGGLMDVSCPNARFCTALDRSGYVLNLHRAV
jgi:hypothetical protein